ncbi:MAG TPA: S-adenosylmethionine:tRNA ribosyltransferase-isomerase [Vicinamibacterales bacterium]|nr:S-adenosylmethionine:tRNA ribosyltransferase-isomerase [Vicinamibacterales bacterium]
MPAHLEATEPPEARGLSRDGVRLLISRIDTDSIHHSRFSDLPQWLSPGDLLVVNTSGTLNAALSAWTTRGDRFELHLSTRLPGNFWVVEVRRLGPVASLPFDDARAGTTFHLEGGGEITLLAPYPLAGALNAQSRLWMAALHLAEPVLTYLERFGSPIRYSYVAASWPGSMYQTVFATESGSAEMPSAGRPFTAELVTRLVSSGIQIAPLLLHTGVASLEDHEPPYEEYFRVPPGTAERVNAARRAGHRVIAVGTTVVRALETVTDGGGTTFPGEGWTNLVITQERPLRAVTGMITGFHEPRATHLAMVKRVIAAAGGAAPAAQLERAYGEAQAAGYLWHEFGDSHLIIGRPCRHAP